MRVITLVLLLAWVPSIANAFTGKEHASMADRALETARRLARPSRGMEDAIDNLKKSQWTFGKVVTGVDWFQTADDLADPEIKDNALRWRRWNILMRGMAAHHNSRHFQREALQTWAFHHNNAIEFAKARKFDRALLSEAVALHYLQDFFSAGHAVTPRRGMHDAAAGDLHDHFGEIGVKFIIDPSVDLLGPLSPSAEQRSSYRAIERLYGDGKLGANAGQELFVEALTVHSIVEVLDQTSSMPSGLPVVEVCARPRRAPRSAIDEGRFIGVTIEGPDGGVRLVHARRSNWKEVPNCESGSWLGRYDAQKEEALTGEYYDLTGLMVRGDSSVGRRSAGPRRLLELRIFALARDPARAMVDEHGENPKGSAMHLQLGSAGPSYIWGNGYSAWGLIWDLTYGTGVSGLSWSTRAGPRFYKYDDNNAVPRFDFGLKASFGFEIASVTVGIDRSYEVDRDGSFGPAYFATFGLEFIAPESWSRYLGPLGHFVRFLVPTFR